MSNIQRRAIVLPIAAIASAQLMSLVTVQATAHSDESGCRPGYYQPGDINRLADHAGAVVHNKLMGYPDAASSALPTVPIRDSAAPESTDVQPAVASEAVPAETATAAIANDGATTESIWAHEQRVPTAAEQSEYQALRQRGMRKMGRTGVPHQTRDTAL